MRYDTEISTAQPEQSFDRCMTERTLGIVNNEGHVMLNRGIHNRKTGAETDYVKTLYTIHGKTFFSHPAGPSKTAHSQL